MIEFVVTKPALCTPRFVKTQVDQRAGKWPIPEAKYLFTYISYLRLAKYILLIKNARFDVTEWRIHCNFHEKTFVVRTFREMLVS